MGSAGRTREHGKTILNMAKRELYGKTKALEFKIEPICVYSVAELDTLPKYSLVFKALVRSYCNRRKRTWPNSFFFRRKPPEEKHYRMQRHEKGSVFIENENNICCYHIVHAACV